MHTFAYSDILNDDPSRHRSTERLALMRAVDLLGRARAAGPDTIVAIEALDYTRRLWTIFVQDLSTVSNDLPAELRASLVSIGLWVLREIEDLRQGKAQGFGDLIEVCTQIAEGLN